MQDARSPHAAAARSADGRARHVRAIPCSPPETHQASPGEHGELALAAASCISRDMPSRTTHAAAWLIAGQWRVQTESRAPWLGTEVSRRGSLAHALPVKLTCCA